MDEWDDLKRKQVAYDNGYQSRNKFSKDEKNDKMMSSPYPNGDVRERFYKEGWRKACKELENERNIKSRGLVGQKGR
jgi:hypothetical protein